MRIPKEGESEVIGTYAGQEVHFVNNGDAKPSLELRKPRSIWSKLKAALDSWPWFARPIKTVPADAGWSENDWYNYAEYKNQRLALLARQADKIKTKIEKARKQKKARKWLYAALEANTAERLRVEAGGS